MTAPTVKALTLNELRARGAPQLFTTSQAEWEEKCVAWFEADTNRQLFPAQVEQVLIHLAAYLFSLLGQEAQFASEQRWLAFAGGDHLDVVLANNATFRLKASSARTTIRFTLADALPQTAVVPAGTRVSAGGDLVFRTDADLAIPAGLLTGDVTATAAEPGERFNGLAIGTIDSVLDALSFAVTAANLTISEGGGDEEDDDSAAARGANALDGISKAGGRLSYVARVLAFSPAITDVAVVRPAPGFIDLYVMLADGDAAVPADAQFRADLLAWVDPETSRPQGDEVDVPSPTGVVYDLTYDVVADGDLDAIQTAIETDARALADALQRRLGAYISKSAFGHIARQQPGVIDHDVTLSGLASRQLEESEYGQLGQLVVNVTGPGHA